MTTRDKMESSYKQVHQTHVANYSSQFNDLIGDDTWLGSEKIFKEERKWVSVAKERG